MSREVVNLPIAASSDQARAARYGMKLFELTASRGLPVITDFLQASLKLDHFFGVLFC